MEQLAHIRRLLDEVEASIDTNASVFPPFSGAEIESLFCDVVDLLQPQLTPYAAAFYWYLLRHSVISNGSSHIRVGTRRLQTGVVKSARSSQVSQSQVQELLAQLEAVAAIRKEGDPNRSGTLYRVMVPSEIPACSEMRSKIDAASTIPVVADIGEIDFYNVRANRVKIYERDDYKCRYCSKLLTEYTVTLDHITPVTAGGGNGFENLITACLQCNSIKTSRRVGDFLIDR